MRYPEALIILPHLMMNVFFQTSYWLIYKNEAIYTRASTAPSKAQSRQKTIESCHDASPEPLQYDKADFGCLQKPI